MLKLLISRCARCSKTGAHSDHFLLHINNWGDCIELHYVELMTWHQIGSALGVSGEHARRSAYAGLDWVDMVGIAAAREGVGGA